MIMERTKVRQIQPTRPDTGGFEGVPFTDRPETERCAQCKFVSKERQHAADLEGAFICRRAPKQVTLFPHGQGIAALGGWPVVTALEWCHEFSPRYDAGAMLQG